MPTDLNILKKAFLNATATYESVTPGNEPLTRRDSVQAEQVFGAPVIPNEVGGWVTSGGFPYQSTEFLAGSNSYPVQTGAMPPARGYSETNPGAAGYPDVDFVPYNWGTNRFGNKGGALLGHPISWEVVGPTAKSPYTHWQWEVQSAFSFELQDGVLSSTFTGGAGLSPDIEDAYDLNPAGISYYNDRGGLYVLITLTGGEADTTGAGSLLAPASPLLPIDPVTSPFEVFRVDSYVGKKLNLVGSKPLTDYFNVLANPKVKSLTFIVPKVTRLAAFPVTVSGQQRNQVFVFLPPETAARSELLPPYIGGGTCPDWTVNGIGGDVSDGVYGANATLPVPVPLYRLSGYIDASLNVLNQMQVNVTLGVGQAISQGQIVRVTSHANDAITSVQEPSVFGYFESGTNLAAPGGTLDLRRVPEVNPATGAIFYGPGPSGGVNELVSVEVYDNISTVFTDPVLNVAKVAATRLDHLIDPRNAPYTFQRFSGANDPVGTVTPPGASIFDTVSGSLNPGNLTNLGFRVVLFPAKNLGGVAVPDFDNPITSDRVVLDPSLPATTVQTIEIDYSAGVLYLSHQPVPGAGCTVAPNGIVGTGTNNPRGEIVLFAACVPYSREPSQRGGGLRVTAARPADATYNPFGANDSFDVYGKRCLATPSPLGAFASGSNLTVSLTTSEAPPQTGWFYFVEVSGGSVSSVSAPNYYPYYDGGVLYSVSVNGGPYNITANTRVVFIKGPWNQVPTTDLWYAGTTRGSSKRTDSLNFKGANVSIGADGSVTVQTVSTLDDAYRAGDPLTPGAGRIITVDGAAVEAQPTAANTDTLKSSFRVTTPNVLGAESLTGFDFKSEAASVDDSPAGFIDRRVFSPTSTSTTLSNSFVVNVVADEVEATGPQFFWFAGTYNSTLLLFGIDLIEIEGVTYVIAGYGGTGDKVLIQNLDGSSPALALTNVLATVYRPRFETNRGRTGTPITNFNSWFAAQEESAQVVTDYPFGALNLYAGSATAIAPGDGGGSVAALAFWARYNLLGSEFTFSLNSFDTLGRFNSILSTTFMTGGSYPDYLYRGDYATRAVKDTIFPTAPAFGHIVEEYSDVEARYDYLSLLPLVPGGSTYNATASLVASGRVQVTSLLNYNLIPYGATVFELLSVNGDATKRGLFLITAGDGVSVFPDGYFFLTDLNGTVGTLALAPLSVANGDLLTFRLYFLASAGKRQNSLYLSSTLSSESHSITQSVGVGLDLNAVGLSISAPIRYVGLPNEDRHAYRVTTASTPGSGVSPSNIETAALDVSGYHKSTDYLYLSSRTITKQINPQIFQPNTTNLQWQWDDTNGWWISAGNSHRIHVPLDLPRSSDRLDSAGARTHRTRLTSITVNGQFHGGAGNEAIVRIWRVFFAGATPTRARLYLGPAVAVQDYLLPSAGLDTSTIIAVWDDAAATLPVYIDDTANTHYYIELLASAVNGNNCLLYGISVTYTDPGPRNY